MVLCKWLRKMLWRSHSWNESTAYFRNSDPDLYFNFSHILHPKYNSKNFQLPIMDNIWIDFWGNYRLRPWVSNLPRHIAVTWCFETFSPFTELGWMCHVHGPSSPQATVWHPWLRPSAVLQAGEAGESWYKQNRQVPPKKLFYFSSLIFIFSYKFLKKDNFSLILV